MSAFLGIDSGTQNTKVLVYDPDRKKIVARASSPHRILSDVTGRSEQEASWWIDAFKFAVKEIPEAIRRAIVGIGVSGQQHGFVPVDAGGKVLAPVKLWNDTSTADECEEITAKYGGNAKLIREVGNLILPGYTASKILWFRKNRPDDYEKLATILLPHDYLNYWLTGNVCMECGDASGTGLLNIRTRRWHESLIRVLDPDRDLLSCLPHLIDSTEATGFLTRRAAEETGLTAGIVVASGGGDNMMGAIGTGTNVKGVLTASLGTSGTLYGFSDKPVIDPEGNLAAFCSSTGGWLPLLCTMNCTVATEQLRLLMKLDHAEMEELARDANPGAEGIITLPFFTGERIPNLPGGRACFMGLNMVNLTPGNLFRSAMESALFGLRLGMESFKSLGFQPSEIKLTGGGARSEVWRKMAADIFDLPVAVPTCDESAAFGAALQAMWCYSHQRGEKVRLNSLLKAHITFDPDKRYVPSDESVDYYRSVYEHYRAYLEAVTPLFS